MAIAIECYIFLVGGCPSRRSFCHPSNLDQKRPTFRKILPCDSGGHTHTLQLAWRLCEPIHRCEVLAAASLEEQTGSHLWGALGHLAGFQIRSRRQDQNNIIPAQLAEFLGNARQRQSLFESHRVVHAGSAATAALAWPFLSLCPRVPVVRKRQKRPVRTTTGKFCFRVPSRVAIFHDVLFLDVFGLLIHESFQEWLIRTSA